MSLEQLESYKRYIIFIVKKNYIKKYNKNITGKKNIITNTNCNTTNNNNWFHIFFIYSKKKYIKKYNKNITGKKNIITNANSTHQTEHIKKNFPMGHGLRFLKLSI